MNDRALAQIGVLNRFSVPRASSTEWDPRAAKLGLSELRRLRGEMAALEAVLVRVLKTETGRDTRAMLARGFGMSDAEARKAEEVADIVGRVPGVEDALADGTVTGEHVRHLKPITDADEAAELLSLATSLSPDEFGKTVSKFRIERDADGWRKRQQKARSVKFFKADNGCVGIRAILPTVEGEQVKAAINEACDAAWRAAHPERAETVGGLDDGGMCCEPGGTAHWTRCDADHDPPWDQGGTTDINKLRHMCGCNCHPHRHETGANITRQPDGTWTVDGETLSPWPPPKRAAAPTADFLEGIRILNLAVGRPA